MHGADFVVSFLGSIVSWPVLLFANVCMTRALKPPECPRPFSTLPFT